MQILTRSGTYETRSANASQPWGSTAPPQPGAVGMTAAGVQITEQSALQLMAVYGSVALIAESIATLPIKQWRQVGSDDAKEIDPAPVIRQPWSEITARDFVIQGTMSMLLRGNLWGKIVSRDARFFPEQIQLVHPDHARVRRDKDGNLEFRYWNDIVPTDNVTRAMALSLPEGLQGLNPIEYMRNSFGLARAQDLYAGSFYANSARMDYVVEMDDDLDEEELERFKLALLGNHQGIQNAHLPGVLTGGAKMKPIQMSMADQEFLAQMQWSAGAISGMFYRVPPHMLGITDKTTSWGAGIEQQELGFVRNTLLIWLCRWEDMMRTWLPPRQFVTFDLSDRLRGDTLQRFSAYQIARVIGIMSGEEIRKAEGLPTITDPVQAAILQDFAAPINSSPVKPGSGGAGGDKAN